MKRYWKYTIMNNKESDADWKFTIQKKLSIIFSKYMIFNWKQTIISFNAVRFVVYVNFDLNSGPQFDPDLKNVRISKSGLTQNRLYFFFILEINKKNSTSKSLSNKILDQKSVPQTVPYLCLWFRCWLVHNCRIKCQKSGDSVCCEIRQIKLDSTSNFSSL